MFYWENAGAVGGELQGPWWGLLAGGSNPPASQLLSWAYAQGGGCTHTPGCLHWGSLNWTVKLQPSVRPNDTGADGGLLPPNLGLSKSRQLFITKILTHVNSYHSLIYHVLKLYNINWKLWGSWHRRTLKHKEGKSLTQGWARGGEGLWNGVHTLNYRPFERLFSTQTGSTLDGKKKKSEQPKKTCRFLEILESTPTPPFFSNFTLSLILSSCIFGVESLGISEQMDKKELKGKRSKVEKVINNIKCENQGKEYVSVNVTVV